MGQQQKVNILLVEDNPDHAELTLKALKDGNLLNAIFWVKDGEEALDFLYHRGRHAIRRRLPAPSSSSSISSSRRWTATRCCAGSKPTRRFERSPWSC